MPQRTDSEAKTWATSFRLTATARELLTRLTADTGLSQAAVIELAIRDLAKRRGIR